MSDGQDVYESSSPDEVVDLFKSGNAFFGISIDAVMRELETTLRQMPGERVRAVRRKGL
jgi:MoaA/NifB/PqqE/SkfB family radical SAM enzyme